MQFYHPAVQKAVHSLRFIGVTGTNGKTTTALMISHVLAKAGIKVGTIGTVYTDCGNGKEPSAYTTPPVNLLAPMLLTMVENKITTVVMEVSSHALVQGRVNGIPFHIGIFTNLTHDHLDYHKTIEAYAHAKESLFAASEISLINADDAYAHSMAWNAKNDIYYYGTASKADFTFSEVKSSKSGTDFLLSFQNKSLPIHVPMPGDFNCYNATAALSAARLSGVSDDILSHALLDFSPAAGRMERVESGRDFDIIIDFAHTPDALSKAISALRSIYDKKIITVFGCGGDRDKEKRPEMGKIATEKSDYVIITSDNPRSEDPVQIIREICAGLHSCNYETEPDRAKAIALAYNKAEAGDVILLAGKGHETTITDKNGSHPFNERTIIENIRKEKGK